MNGAPKFPPYAYVPGQNMRHPEGWFDAIRGTVPPMGAPESEFARSEAFVTGLAYLENGYFWEAHEVFEPVWMACPQNSESRAAVQGLIQLANARLKQKMGRSKAAKRLYAIARDHLNWVKSGVAFGVDIEAISRNIDSVQSHK